MSALVNGLFDEQVFMCYSKRATPWKNSSSIVNFISKTKANQFTLYPSRADPQQPDQGWPNLARTTESFWRSLAQAWPDWLLEVPCSQTGWGSLQDQVFPAGHICLSNLVPTGKPGGAEITAHCSLVEPWSHAFTLGSDRQTPFNASSLPAGCYCTVCGLFSKCL